MKQRYLIDSMDAAAVRFTDKYTRDDGSLIWRSCWPGMDGSDDGYESFVSFPLHYLLGGGEHVHRLARRQWEAVTRQFTDYGQVYREYDGNYDWMHHGESSTYLYYLGLANPNHTLDRHRALAFADMYTGADPAAPNWNLELKMIRSPLTGSRGPLFSMSAEDWSTHRPVLSHYLAPYEDIPGYPVGDAAAVLDWMDDRVFAAILETMNARMVPGDVPLNLNATSLVTNAFLYSSDHRYRDWVFQYLSAWKDRAAKNGGILPDNIGPSGVIGERMHGKWWGGYYGWHWPHGAPIILESTLIAGCNATLLSGDRSWLDLFRSQADLQWSLREERDGRTVVPFRHGDSGWFDFRPPEPRHLLHAYFLSREPGDLERIHERFPGRSRWYQEPSVFGKAGHFFPEKWFGFVSGEYDGYVEAVLDDTMRCMRYRLDKMDADDLAKAETWDVHHWQDVNPVVPEGLIQMSMGTPAAIYHGGLLHATVRYFDPVNKRPGLPKHAAALVDRIFPDGFYLTLVNTDPLESVEILVQAGCFAEHGFTCIKKIEKEFLSPDSTGMNIELREPAGVFAVSIEPWAQVRLHVTMDRFRFTPTYAFPWERQQDYMDRAGNYRGRRN